ncbi:hypothetical protein ACS0TY_006441 [Phlomoides rotata]
MKEGSLMRVSSCKIHCPFICFCKPTAAHLYSSAPLKLESTPHVVPSTLFADSDKPSEGVKEEAVNGKDEEAENGARSCIRKRSEAGKHVGKKRVQWKDNFGKQLAEIKEFESSETGDTDNEDESSRCLCIIL